MTPNVITLRWDVSTVAGYHKVRIAVTQLVGYYMRRISFLKRKNCVCVPPVVKGRCWETEIVTYSLVRAEGR